jgi:hypothetical protein
MRVYKYHDVRYRALSEFSRLHTCNEQSSLPSIRGGRLAEQKKSFPMLPIAHWWKLRKKFKQSLPGVVSDGYLATVLKMGANSARANERGVKS